MVAAAALHHAKERSSRGLTLLEGHHVVSAAIQRGAHLEEVFVREGTSRLPAGGRELNVIEVTDPVLERLAGTGSPAGPIAVMKIPVSARLETHPTVVLCGIADPGNTGTLIRTAAAFGYHVAVAPGSADPWSPKVLRSAAGGHFFTRITRLGAQLDAALSAADLLGVALVSRDGQDLDEALDGTLALLVGSEAHGLDATALAAARQRVTIAMAPGSESLNAAVAGAIAMHRYRQ